MKNRSNLKSTDRKPQANLSPENGIDPEINPQRAIGRRALLGGALAVGAGLVFAACSSSGSSDTTVANTTPADTTPVETTPVETTPVDTTPADTTPVETAPAATETTAAPAAAPANNDAAIAMLAASLEVLAVNTYGAALDAAGAGKIGDVPPAVAEFATTAKAHHQAHLDAWNKVLTGAGAAAVTTPNATLQPTVDEAFAKITDVTGVAKLALQLEEIAAATYLSASPNITDKAAIQLAGSIQVIDAQHAAILHYVLGEYPVPDVFAKTDLAAAA